MIVLLHLIGEVVKRCEQYDVTQWPVTETPVNWSLAVGGATVLGDPIWDPKTCSFCGQRLMLHLKCAANVFNSFVCNSLPTLLKSIHPIQSIQSYSIHQFSRYKIYIEHTKNGQNKHRQHIHTTNPHLSAFFSHSSPAGLHSGIATTVQDLATLQLLKFSKGVQCESTATWQHVIFQCWIISMSLLLGGTLWILVRHCGGLFCVCHGVFTGSLIQCNSTKSRSILKNIANSNHS